MLDASLLQPASLWYEDKRQYIPGLLKVTHSVYSYCGRDHGRVRFKGQIREKVDGQGKNFAVMK